ncbi:Lateral signaling target protein 2-like protein [Diplonema papillatum]|nr:Lateral signaling target protein 2-like protein [Diplonema papillatum]KAJ9459605.1 Lateral signaling target protein 2-like protein [Diplonema papillatum]
MSRQKEILDRRHAGVMDVLADIDVALPYSCPGHLKEYQVRSMVARILYTFALRNRGIGYIQGFNTVAAVLVSILDEEQAFWALCAVAENVVSSYTSLRTVLADLAVLEKMLQIVDNELYEHLTGVSASIPALFSSFVVGIFSARLPPETCLLLWVPIFRSSHPEVAVLRTVCGILAVVREQIMGAGNVADVTQRLKEATDGLYGVDDILTQSRLTGEKISDEEIELERNTMHVNIERDSVTLQTARSVFELVNSGKLTRQTLKQMQTQWKGHADDQITQHQFFLMMEDIGIRAADFDLCKIYRQWEQEGSIINFRHLMLGLVILMDGSLKERLRTVVDLMLLGHDDDEGTGKTENKVGIDHALYQDITQSRVWRNEATSNSLHSLKDRPLAGGAASDAIADSIFAQLDLDADGKLSVSEFLTAVLSTPTMCLLLNSPGSAEEASIWTPGDNQPPWIPDQHAPECFLCKKGFRWYRRRHHCRSCGQVACNDCTRVRRSIAVMGFKSPVRMCTACSEQMVASQDS